MQDCTSQVIFYTIKNWKEQKKKKKKKKRFCEIELKKHIPNLTLTP
jgi:hypothetical protein